MTDDDDYLRPRVIYVYTSCDGERLDESKITIDDVWEAFDGTDMVKFVCPKCGASHESRRFG